MISMNKEVFLCYLALTLIDNLTLYPIEIMSHANRNSWNSDSLVDKGTF